MMDFSKYPPNWRTEIRPRILKRANYTCEFCGAKDRTVIRKQYQNGFEREIKIFLAVAHLDHDPENWDIKDDRLAALCRGCHVAYDTKHKREKLAKPKSFSENKVKTGKGSTKANKTHCPKGHPYSGENLMQYKGNGRKCKICHVLHSENSIRNKVIKRLEKENSKPRICRFKLREARIACGLTQQTLSSLAGLNVINIAKFEIGTKNPGIDAISKLAKALGLKNEDLFQSKN